MFPVFRESGLFFFFLSSSRIFNSFSLSLSLSDLPYLALRLSTIALRLQLSIFPSLKFLTYPRRLKFLSTFVFFFFLRIGPLFLVLSQPLPFSLSPVFENRIILRLSLLPERRQSLTFSVPSLFLALFLSLSLFLSFCFLVSLPGFRLWPSLPLSCLTCSRHFCCHQKSFEPLLTQSLAFPFYLRSLLPFPSPHPLLSTPLELRTVLYLFSRGPSSRTAFAFLNSDARRAARLKREEEEEGAEEKRETLSQPCSTAATRYL